MSRTLQVLKSIYRVVRARMADPYGWKCQIAEECLRLGGVYVKFLQMLAVHASTKHIVDGMGSELAFEHVPYEPIDVEAELGPLMGKLKTIQPGPLAAGSYGQVYLAQTQDARKVIIKILRPSVRRTLRTDLRIIVVLATVADWFIQNSLVNIAELAREFARATAAETNYLLEAQNGERLRAYYTERDTLVIPRTYTELTTRYVLVQEYIGGVSLASVSAKQREGYAIDALVQQAVGSDVWAQSRVLGTELLRATIYADYMMVDPHPGNVRLLPNNKVALIDFGLVSRAPSNREAFAMVIHELRKLYQDKFDPGTMAVAMLAYFDEDLHKALEIVTRERTDDYTSSLATFVGKVAQAHMQDVRMQHYIADRQALKLFMNIFNEGNRLGIQLDKENVLLQRSMIMFMSVFREIGQAHDGNVHFTGMLDCLAAVDEEILQRGVGQVPSRPMSDERAFELVSNWLSTIAERDRHLYKFITRRSYA